jgi:hypothetical protein
MRRVVTGDQIAQLRNPDPFAVPAWRSPVYRTPLAIVAIVHFVRMIVWLVRFLFRHPVLVLAAIIGVLMWRLVGWLGLVVLAVSITAVLVAWRWRLPSSFSRFIGSPARGQWRAWHYRRRWAAVMTIGRLAPVYQGRVLLPVLAPMPSPPAIKRGSPPTPASMWTGARSQLAPISISGSRLMRLRSSGRHCRTIATWSTGTSNRTSAHCASRRSAPPR